MLTANAHRGSLALIALRLAGGGLFTALAWQRPQPCAW